MDENINPFVARTNSLFPSTHLPTKTYKRRGPRPPTTLAPATTENKPPPAPASRHPPDALRGLKGKEQSQQQPRDRHHQTKVPSAAPAAGTGRKRLPLGQGQGPAPLAQRTNNSQLQSPATTRAVTTPLRTRTSSQQPAVLTGLSLPPSTLGIFHDSPDQTQNVPVPTRPTAIDNDHDDHASIYGSPSDMSISSLASTESGTGMAVQANDRLQLQQPQQPQRTPIRRQPSASHAKVLSTPTGHASPWAITDSPPRRPSTRTIKRTVRQGDNNADKDRRHRDDKEDSPFITNLFKTMLPYPQQPWDHDSDSSMILMSAIKPATVPPPQMDNATDEEDAATVSAQALALEDELDEDDDADDDDDPIVSYGNGEFANMGQQPSSEDSRSGALVHLYMQRDVRALPATTEHDELTL
ncbi:hypothetical protein DFJ77DRAFT_480918 [Powellomyces hirtus]|nr:hypothetical protein DFJ77DRAFT_480918 [Powellomyces hirtus]